MLLSSNSEKHIVISFSHSENFTERKLFSLIQYVQIKFWYYKDKTKLQ